MKAIIFLLLSVVGIIYFGYNRYKYKKGFTAEEYEKLFKEYNTTMIIVFVAILIDNILKILNVTL